VDVVVAGLGVMGGAVAAELSRRGLRVLGLDPESPPHRRGSSHGETRMIRKTYSEEPLYVPLVRTAYRGWRDLEQRTGRRLLFETGGLVGGLPDGTLLRGAERSAAAHGLPLERPDAETARERYPFLALPPDQRLVVDPGAGYLRAEPCVSAFLDLARARGAELRTGESLLGWTEQAAGDGGGLLVRTSSGAVAAGGLVLAVGAWTAGLAAAPPLPLRPVRMVQHWFRAEEPSFDPAALPVFLIEYAPGEILYGFPDVGTGVKAAFHHGGRPIDPDGPRPVASGEEVAAVREALARHFPGARWTALRSEPCLYTLTPDRHFVLDRNPASTRVVIAAGFSGHGFKFAPALASVAADLLQGLEPAFDPAPFRIDRFGAGAPDRP
jgi:sarcosine oxidase